MIRFRKSRARTWFNSIVSARTPLLVFAGLALAGAALWPLRVFLDAAGATDRTASANCAAELNSARWTSVAMPGGMRALIADGLWLKVYAAWADRDPARTEALIHWVTLVDDRPTHFWVNGARIIAYDVPEWRLAGTNGGPVPSEVRKRVIEEQACEALDYLAEARIHHPESGAIWVEMGNIHLYRRKDLALAADCYRRAAESRDVPYYAARIHAELLRRLGRDQEAYDWLCRLHPTLPGDDEAAMPDLVLRRIRDLEDKLQVADKYRYRQTNIRTAQPRFKSLVD
jgi:tetratricopeptide (TPR) repeat protein